MSVKYIFVTGGVVSGLGKGITAASVGRLLKSRGYKVTLQKLDPYINIDPREMSPLQHGEIFVTEDGAETDLDIGHYERFVDENMHRLSNISSGKIHWNVLNKERRGEFFGGTVQVIPHITNEIKSIIYSAAETSESDVLITEIGGTVGDIESQPFIESIRQVEREVGSDNVLFIHVTLVPYLSRSGELKTKPTQHSVKELRSIGVHPDIIVCRSEVAIPQDIKDKIGLFCSVNANCVIENKDADWLYEVPLLLEDQGMGKVVCGKLGLEDNPDLSEWREMVSKAKTLSKKVRIALVGKYVEMFDCYLSLTEALRHAGIACDAEVDLKLINSDALTEDNIKDELKSCSAVVCPTGALEQGSDGKVVAAGYARTEGLPFIGIGFGMQLAAIEFARNVCGLKGANSCEFDAETPEPVVYLPQADGENGIRLGAYECDLEKGSLLADIYKTGRVYERHNNKYEVNPDYKDDFAQKGMVFTATSSNGKYIEAFELKEHPFFVGVAFLPEYKSRPNKPHPIYVRLVKAALNK